MAQSNEELSLRLSERGASQTPLSIHHELKTWFDKALPSIQDLCGPEEARKLFACAKVAINRNAALLSCSKVSLQNCILQSMAMKLYPGPMSECAYVPFGSEATFVPQYQGIIKHAIQGGSVKAVGATLVYANERFEYEEGSEPYIKHWPILREKDRGEIIAAYATATLPNGTKMFAVMGIDDINAIKARSPSVKRKKFSPWDSDFGEMAKKTVLKRLLKLVPKSTELADILEYDNGLERPDLVKPSIVPTTDGLNDSSLLGVEDGDEDGLREKEERNKEG